MATCTLLISTDDATARDIIALRHCFQNGEQKTPLKLTLGKSHEPESDSYTNIMRLLDDMAERFMGESVNAPASSCVFIEVKDASLVSLIEDFLAPDSPDQTTEQAERTKLLYGLLVGDEGWDFIPHSHSLTMLRRGYTTREFAWTAGFSNAVLTMNGKGATSYGDWQAAYWKAYFDNDEQGDYFKKDFSIAGLGSTLNAVEQATWHKHIAINLQERFDCVCLKYGSRALKFSEVTHLQSDVLQHRKTLHKGYSVGEFGRLESLAAATVGLDSIEHNLEMLNHIAGVLRQDELDNRTTFLTGVAATVGAFGIAAAFIAAIAAVGQIRTRRLPISMEAIRSYSVIVLIICAGVAALVLSLILLRLRKKAAGR